VPLFKKGTGGSEGDKLNPKRTVFKIAGKDGSMYTSFDIAYNISYFSY